MVTTVIVVALAVLRITSCAPATPGQHGKSSQQVTPFHGALHPIGHLQPVAFSLGSFPVQQSGRAAPVAASTHASAPVAQAGQATGFPFGQTPASFSSGSGLVPFSTIQLQQFPVGVQAAPAQPVHNQAVPQQQQSQNVVPSAFITSTGEVIRGLSQVDQPQPAQQQAIHLIPVQQSSIPASGGASQQQAVDGVPVIVVRRTGQDSVNTDSFSGQSGSQDSTADGVPVIIIQRNRQEQQRASENGGVPVITLQTNGDQTQRGEELIAIRRSDFENGRAAENDRRTIVLTDDGGQRRESQILRLTPLRETTRPDGGQSLVLDTSRGGEQIIAIRSQSPQSGRTNEANNDQELVDIVNALARSQGPRESVRLHSALHESDARGHGGRIIDRLIENASRRRHE